MAKKTDLSREKEHYSRHERVAVKSPSVTAPGDPSPVAEHDLPVRFTYVPVEGLFAGDPVTWSRASEITPAGNILRKTNRLAQWLTKNPLSVVYGRIRNDKLLVTSIYAGGDWVREEEARKFTPDLQWLEAEA